MSKCAKVLRGRNEAAEEQRRDDRPGKGVRRDVVEVGDLGGEPGIVRLPERQPPDRIVDLGGGGFEPGGEIVIVGEDRAAAPGRARRARRRSGSPW